MKENEGCLEGHHCKVVLRDNPKGPSHRGVQ